MIRAEVEALSRTLRTYGVSVLKGVCTRDEA